MTETTGYRETLDIFLTRIDNTPKLVVCVEDEQEVRLGLVNALKATETFFPTENYPALQTLLDGLPEGVLAHESVSPDEHYILATSLGESALALTAELFGVGFRRTLGVHDIKLVPKENQEKVPMNGLQAASYMAGFDGAPIVVHTAYAAEHLLKSRFETSVPMLLVEKSPTSIDTVCEVGLAVQKYTLVLSELQRTLQRRKEYEHTLGLAVTSLKKVLGVNGSDYQTAMLSMLAEDVNEQLARVMQTLGKYDVFKIDELDSDMGRAFTSIEKARNVNNFAFKGKYNTLTGRVSELDRNIRSVLATFSTIKETAWVDEIRSDLFNAVYSLDTALNSEVTFDDIMGFDTVLPTVSLVTLQQKVAAMVPDVAEVKYTLASDGEYDASRLSSVALGLRQIVVGYDYAAVTSEVKGANDKLVLSLNAHDDADRVYVTLDMAVAEERRDSVSIYLGARLYDTMAHVLFKRASPRFSSDSDFAMSKTDSGIRVAITLDKADLYLPFE